jgi:hypothetical protein
MSTIRTIATTLAALLAVPAAAAAQDAPAPAAAPAAPAAPPTPPPPAPPPTEPAPASAPAPAPAAAPPAAAVDEPTLERQLAQAETRAAAEIVVEPPADRRGLTVEVGLGLALVDVTVDGDDDGGSLVGGRTVSVGVGGYAAPRFVLGGRVVIGSVTAYDSFLPRETTVTTVLIGPSLQIWAHDRFFLGATAGVATVLDNLPASAADRGPGVEARVGVVAPVTRGHGLVVAASVNSTLLDEWSITSYGVQVGWQGF